MAFTACKKQQEEKPDAKSCDIELELYNAAQVTAIADSTAFENHKATVPGIIQGKINQLV